MKVYAIAEHRAEESSIDQTFVRDAGLLSKFEVLRNYMKGWGWEDLETAETVEDLQEIALADSSVISIIEIPEEIFHADS